jgi:hypothetical protein
MVHGVEVVIHWPVSSDVGISEVIVRVIEGARDLVKTLVIRSIGLILQFVHIDQEVVEITGDFVELAVIHFESSPP